ncbi:hypothetical protein T08_10362 [Trichinella sp. T8]|nr:hypothetical protein T08_10362 [Trichinella sp. T8]
MLWCRAGTMIQPCKEGKDMLRQLVKEYVKNENSDCY